MKTFHSMNLQIKSGTDIIYRYSSAVFFIAAVQNNAVDVDSTVFRISFDAFHAVVTDFFGIEIAAVTFAAADAFTVIQNTLTMYCHIPEHLLF